MSSKTLIKVDEQNFPPDWININYLPDSKARRIEIYLANKEGLLEGLILMFHFLFRDSKSSIIIYNNSWWDFCLDTWDHIEDKYDYELEGKSKESKEYLIMLKESAIENEYQGVCYCENWDRFLSVVLACILTHQAPYSPIFYEKKNEFFFYFHHTGSIGFYYKSENEVVSKILRIAEEEYELS